MSREVTLVRRATGTALIALATAGSIPIVKAAAASPEAAQGPARPVATTAATFAQRLVARAPVAQQSTETDQSQDPRLDGTGRYPYAGTIVRKRWWTVDEPRDTAYDQIAAQTPARTRQSGHGGDSGAKQVSYDPSRLPGSVYLADLEVDVVALNRSQSAVGAFAIVVRQPKRPRRENVKLGSLRAVRLVHETYPGGEVLRRRTVTGERATRLARLFDRMRVVPAHHQPCPRSPGTTTIVRFLGRHLTWVVSPFCGASYMATYDVQRNRQRLPQVSAGGYKYRWMVHRDLRR